MFDRWAHEIRIRLIPARVRWIMFKSRWRRPVPYNPHFGLQCRCIIAPVIATPNHSESESESSC